MHDGTPFSTEPSRPSFDFRYNEFNHKRQAPGTEGRPFAYLVQTGGRFLYASAIRMVVLKAVVSMSVSRKHQHACGALGVSMQTQLTHSFRLLQTPWPWAR